MRNDWLGDLIADDRAALRRTLPVAEGMAGTRQDPVFHAEGDVWTHAIMVLDEAIGSNARSGRSGSLSGVAMLVAAALHDCAKPLVTETIWDEPLGRDRVASPGHAAKGANLAWRLLSETSASLPLRWRVCQIVAWHHKAGHLHEKTPESAAIDVMRFAASGVPWSDLSDFCRCDTVGRIGPDPSDALAALDLSDEIAAAAGSAAGNDLFRSAWDPGPEFRSRLGRERPETPYGYEPRWNGRLIVTCGLPGSGKSSWARRRAELNGATIVSADDIREETSGWKRDKRHEGRVFQEFDARLRAALAAGGEVIADGTFLTAAIRSKLTSLGDAYGMRTSVALMDVPLSLAKERNAARPDPVPDTVMERFAATLSLPSAVGSHDIVVIDRDGEETSLTGDLSRDHGHDVPTP